MRISPACRTYFFEHGQTASRQVLFQKSLMLSQETWTNSDGIGKAASALAIDLPSLYASQQLHKRDKCQLCFVGIMLLFRASPYYAAPHIRGELLMNDPFESLPHSQGILTWPDTTAIDPGALLRCRKKIDFSSPANR